MERIGSEVERTLGRTGSRDAIPLAAITDAWPGAVGETVARKAWPLRLARDGTLHVATVSATWAHELDLLQDEVLAALRGCLGDASPARLRFAVGPLPEPSSSEADAVSTPVGAPPDVPPEIERAASSAASVIDDPELRELVSRAARASLLKAPSGRHFW